MKSFLLLFSCILVASSVQAECILNSNGGVDAKIKDSLVSKEIKKLERSLRKNVANKKARKLIKNKISKFENILDTCRGELIELEEPESMDPIEEESYNEVLCMIRSIGQICLVSGKCYPHMIYLTKKGDRDIITEELVQLCEDKIDQFSQQGVETKNISCLVNCAS